MHLYLFKAGDLLVTQLLSQVRFYKRNFASPSRCFRQLVGLVRICRIPIERIDRIPVVSRRIYLQDLREMSCHSEYSFEEPIAIPDRSLSSASSAIEPCVVSSPAPRIIYKVIIIILIFKS